MRTRLMISSHDGKSPCQNLLLILVVAWRSTMVQAIKNLCEVGSLIRVRMPAIFDEFLQLGISVLRQRRPDSRTKGLHSFSTSLSHYLVQWKETGENLVAKNSKGINIPLFVKPALLFVCFHPPLVRKLGLSLQQNLHFGSPIIISASKGVPS